jgi:hypothetical protein
MVLYQLRLGQLANVVSYLGSTRCLLIVGSGLRVVGSPLSVCLSVADGLGILRRRHQFDIIVTPWCVCVHPLAHRQKNHAPGIFWGDTRVQGMADHSGHPCRIFVYGGVH